MYNGHLLRAGPAYILIFVTYIIKSFYCVLYY